MPQRNNFRSGRSTTGNGRMGSYNRERDHERGINFSLSKENQSNKPCVGSVDNREASRDSTEEIGEWKQSNGEGYSRDRDFRRYEDNVQIFCGNIPHATTEDNLKVISLRN